MAQSPPDLIAKIARDTLGIGRLERQGRDILDFHDVSVSSVRRALQAAFDAGAQSAKPVEAEARKYRVRLTVEVSDVLETFIEVEATDKGCAHVAARTLAAAGLDELNWQWAYERDRAAPEVDSVTLITPETSHE